MSEFEGFRANLKFRSQASVCSQAIMVAALVGVSAPAFAQSIANGSFDSASSGSTYSLGSIPSWNLVINDTSQTGNSCLLVNGATNGMCLPGGTQSPSGYPGAAASGNFIDLSPTSSLSQNLNLDGVLPGQKYTLSFGQAATDTGGKLTATDTVHWIVSVNGTVIFTSTDMMFAGNSSSPWGLFSTTFTAGTNPDTLTFTAFASSTDSHDSPLALIDSISLSSNGQPVNAPEPATLAVFGIGLAGLAAARRRRNRQCGLSVAANTNVLPEAA